MVPSYCFTSIGAGVRPGTFWNHSWLESEKAWCLPHQTRPRHGRGSRVPFHRSQKQQQPTKTPTMKQNADRLPFKRNNNLGSGTPKNMGSSLWIPAVGISAKEICPRPLPWEYLPRRYSHGSEPALLFLSIDLFYFITFFRRKHKNCWLRT